MPSEAQSQEPRDRGPPPPITRAGRSAQLAKAAATSSALERERRPRGRPRKDGSSGRSALPAPPPSPPPPPKPRKKGRSRGRAQIEDEESMGATEKNPPHQTEVKERTTGRRRSTSRRKSNTNPEPGPEPSQDRLNQAPEHHPDPNPDPLHLGPTISKASPEPAPSTEEGSSTSPAHVVMFLASNPGPASSPGEQSQISPHPASPSPSTDCNLVHSLTPRPAPGPVEEDWYSPIHRPPPMEVDCSPGTVPMETEGASPMGKSPDLSPCSSPPVSPCLRLEDEDSLSPLFQRSLSEESGGSPTPSLGHTQKRLKQCAFCYRGDEPLLGQGRLVVFGPTPGYIPLHILNRRASSDRDNDCHDHCYRSDQAPPSCSSPDQCDSSSEFVEQLGPIGLPHDINVQSLFDPTGQCCAHLQCAAWSEGVCRGEGQSLLYVDKAIDSGSTQVCAFCRRLGASLRCQETDCGRSYHFPCAAAAGAHQDWKHRHTLCTRHTHAVSSQCLLCSSACDVSGLLMCCCCGNCYHGSCLDPPLAPSALCRAGWQCPECRVCQSCRLRGDDGSLLVCERCDKAYHTCCLTPPLDHIPSTSWRCKNCRICRRCGVRSSGQWANHPFLCKSCDPTLPCPLCGHAPNTYTPQEYLICTCCYRCVHTECIVQAGEGRAGSENYICSTCRPQEEDLILNTPISHSPARPLSPLTISLSPSPIQTEDPPISSTTHSPVQVIGLEPPKSPIKTRHTQQSPAPTHPDPSELQQSPPPTHPDPSELQQSPPPTHPDPSELQQSPPPTHPDLLELQQSPPPTHPDPSELQQSPPPTHPDPSELQQSPPPTHPDPLELQQSPPPTHPDPLELQQSPPPTHPDPSELQQSPPPTHPDPSELQQSPPPTHPDPSALQQSPPPTHPDPSELQQSPPPTHPDPSELQQSPPPTHPDPSDLQQSPPPTHPDPSDLQQSPPPTHPDPSELQQSPPPTHPDPSDLQQSPPNTHPSPSEHQQSPPNTHPSPSEHQQSPPNTHRSPSEHQQSPPPTHPDPSELRQSPPPTHPDPSELRQSPPPTHPDPSELRQSPPPTHPDSSELRQSPPPTHPDPSELRQSPAPTHPDPSELRQSPAPTHPDPSELRQSPAPTHPDPSELRQSPAPTHPDPSELRQSPPPTHPDLSELRQSPPPTHPDSSEVHSPALSELQQSLTPTHPDAFQLQQSPSHGYPDQSELHQSPAPSDLQQNPASTHPDLSELHQSPAPAYYDPSELQENPASSEHQQNPALDNPDPSEPQQSPAPNHHELPELQQSPLPPELPSTHPDLSELQQSPASSHPDPSEHQKSPPPSYSGEIDLETRPSQSCLDTGELQQSPAPSHPNLTQQKLLQFHHVPAKVHDNCTQSHHSSTQLQKRTMSSRPGPTELQKTLTQMASMQDQNSPCQLSCTSPKQNSADIRHTATESQQSLAQGSPMSHSLGQFLPRPSLNSPPQVQLGLAESQHSPQSPARDPTAQTQHDSSCSPAVTIIAESQHSPLQTGNSPTPHSPAEGLTSPSQSPIQEVESTLDQESPGSSNPAQLQCGPAQEISTLDQDLSTIYCRSAQTQRRHASLRPLSAPCSPSASPLRPIQCSQSQPASPAQHSLLPSWLSAQLGVTEECTQTSTTELNFLEHCPAQVSSNLNGQTLESSPVPLSPNSELPTVPPDSHSTDNPSPTCSSHQVPAVIAPESLVHTSTSAEHSSLTLSPCADEMEESLPPASQVHQSPSCDRLSSYIEGKVSPIHIQASQAHASPAQASEMPTSPTSSFQAFANPTHISPGAVWTSPAAKATPTHSPPGSPVHTSVCHTCSVHAEPKSGSGLLGSVGRQEGTSPDVCSFAELAQNRVTQSPINPHQLSHSHAQTTCSPLQSPASFSPSHCRLTATSPAICPISHSLSNVTSDSSGKRGPHSASITDVCVIHSPPGSSPAGQDSPIHIRSTFTCAHSGPLQRPSFTNSTYSSPAHASVVCVSPSHSPAQASETDHRPTHTGTKSGLSSSQLCPSLVSSSLNLDTADSSLIRNSVHPSTVDLDPGLFTPIDSVTQISPHPASSLPNDSAAASPNQANLTQVHQPPVSPPPAPDRSAGESRTNTALVSPLYQRPPSPVDATSTEASLGPSSPDHISPTQDNTAMPDMSPNTCSPPPVPSQLSPAQIPSSQASQALASSVHDGPAAGPVCGPMDSGETLTTPSSGSVSPERPDVILSPTIKSTMRCEASPVPSPVCSLVPPVKSENSHSLGPAGPVQPEAGLGSGPGSYSVPSCQQDTEAEEESVATVDFNMANKQKEEVEQSKTDEEIDREATQKQEEQPVGRMEEGERAQEKDPSSGIQSTLVLNEDHYSPSHTAPASPFLSQPAPPSCKTPTPQSALPVQYPSTSPTSPPPSHHILSPHSPPPCPPGAGTPEVSTPASTPHKSALPRPCFHHTRSPFCPQPQEELSTIEREIKIATGSEDEPEDKTLSSQSQRQFEPIAVATEPTKDERQSHMVPSHWEEEEPTDTLEPASERVATPEAGQQPMRERKEVEEGEEVEGVRGRIYEEEEEPVSPVLDLDTSFDKEVMELMTSSPPPSLLHLSSSSTPPLSRRGKGRILRPPPSSARPSDDLSIRLRQSPFSTEASPETSPTRTPVSPPPLSPLSPPLRSSPSSRESPPLSKAPPITVLPLTPKIGMGKPAISKRKFSPGRARVKQGSWWSNRRAVSPPSSSQDSTGEGGWDSPKPRPPDSPLWSMRVGRGSGFPGRRRSRGGGVGGGRGGGGAGGGGRGRSRLKTQDSQTVSPAGGYLEPFQPKEEEENSMHNTVVMFSTSDHFTLRQDMCVVCGSFGQGAEGRLLACSQCGQCYHPYCVNVKITRVVLTKGWRCLECTVCEACGKASDPGRLLLCDDCDISYHTYCLDPPLHTVPKGAWKCKWCVWCVQCGSTSPGLHCDWQNNYSRCGPCASLSRCPLCQRQYTQDDLILQCQQCDRWVHAVCQGLTTEDEVEVASDEGFDCSLCRTHSRGSYGSSDSFDSPYMAQIISRIREPDVKTYTQDGVCLTESGLSHLQSLVEPLTSPRKYRRCKPKLKLRIINQNSVSVLQTPPDTNPPTEQDHRRGDLDCDMKSDSSPERDHTHDDDVTKEPEVTDSNKKRKRKPYRPGIGGFMVRQRGGKAGPSRIKLCRKDSSEAILGQDERLLDAEVSIETALPGDQMMEKVKKRYRKKKTKLEEAFPSYLQEAFFGRDLLDRSRQVDRKPGPQMPGGSQSGAATADVQSIAPGLHGPSPSGVSAMTTSKRTLPMSEEALMDLSDVLNTDPHILATGHTGQFQVERSPSPFAGLDIGCMTDDTSLISEPTGSVGRGQRMVQEEPLDAILSPELDKMVSDGAILSKLYKIPELEGKDVEEVFTAVLSPNSSNNQVEQIQHTYTAPGSKTHTHHTAAVFPRLPLVNGLTGAPSHFTTVPMSSIQGQAGFRMPPPDAPISGTTLANQAVAAEGEQDVMSTAQRGMLKWEKEETLGELATVAPVLYCNTNFPQLREQFPDWSTRVKQIAKLWRKASSQDRAPYVQKARDNRAAQRINKVQLSDPLKRQSPLQQQQLPLPGPYDPVSMETEVAFKDPLRPKESEQEQEWKLRQQMRQKSKQLAKMEATQKLEQVKNEQRQQQLLASQRLVGRQSPETSSRSPLTPAQQVTGDNASPLHSSASRDGQSRQQLLLQGGQSSGLADDVFLRPQAPPPSGFSSLPHSPHPSSPLHQPPSSPQMFSPPSSRPSSPWDPYSKVVGTPRPPSSQSGAPPGPQQQRHNSLSASPAHDVFGSPAPSPDGKTSDVPRVLGPQPGLQQTRTGSTPDHANRLVGLRGAEHQRPPHGGTLRLSESYGRSSELVQGGVFKAPMPPQHQPQQEVFGGPTGGRRDQSRPTDLSFTLSQSQDPPFPSSPLSGLGSPHRSPYGQTPGTPRPEYSQQIPDSFTQHSALPSRPSPDHYTNPQTPSTPRPHTDPTYLTTPPALRLDQYNQQSANRRPSPSHPNLDPYASNPGTPRPSITDRFPRSPGSQRSSDPYTQPVGTPRPSPDPYSQQPSTPRPQKAPETFIQAPGESFTPHPAGPGSSPLAPGLSGETGAFSPTHHQSPGRQHQQDSFPRTPSVQTPKHPGTSEEGGFSSLASQTPGHDPFDQGRMTPGPVQMDKTAANEIAALGVASLDSPMSMLPQPGDSEEKLRQRQRLRQLILRQQQQKSAFRQEKGLQEPAMTPAATPGPTSGPGTPHHWSQEDSTVPPTDLFGRPPPPYPGAVRPGGLVVASAQRFPGGFPGEQLRTLTPNEAVFPRESLPREPGVRGPVLRFIGPPGAPAGLQDSFLRPPQGSMPGPGVAGVEGVTVQMRRPIPGEFSSIRPPVTPSAHPHVMPGVSQPFLPRSHPIQQHSIMGQPYIELRHRAPENRLRLPFPPPAAPDCEAPLLPHRDPQASLVRPGLGARMGETPLGQQMVIAGGVDQLNQQDQQHLGHTAALTQSGDSTLPGADGIEEHLEGEDSAVKDLEDVEVKDLVDLNLNLDPEDGKEDLDLGPNDLHLDDFLLSGKFDLIAYADPELNLEDKKDMFHEELDLEPVEEKDKGERKDGTTGSRRTESHTPLGQVKQEVIGGIKTEGGETVQHLTVQLGVVATSVPPGPPNAKEVSSSQPGSTVLMKEKVEDSDSGSGAVPALQGQEKALSSAVAPRVHPPMSAGQQSVFQQQRPLGPSPSAVLTPNPQGHPILTPQGPPPPTQPLSHQPPQSHLLVNPQTQPLHPGATTQIQTQGQVVFSPNQNQVQNQNKARPLLLEEQPLLLQDLLDQERQEQQQQKQMQALIRQKSTSESVFPNMDFDSISDPIMKAKMVALKGINKVMTQGNLTLNPMVISRFQQAPAPAAGAPGPEGTPQPSQLIGQDTKVNPQLVRPSPPSFGPGFVNESQRRQYEEWLGETQRLLQMQQRLLEDQIAAHRKTKKALSAKQRTAKKAGRAFAEEDAAQLRYITEQQGTVQKQLEQIRKQQKDHAELIEDYRTKQQQRALQQQPTAAPPMLPSGVPLSPQPMVPMQPRPGGPSPACVQNVPPGWTPGGGAPGVMVQRIQPQMPPTLTSAPQASPHPPQVMVPSLATPTTSFSTGSRGPVGGPNGPAGDGAPTPQVKFDDNNPFSEGFQERERRERLREQQERQRVQLMQEVERQRALQQRLELEQQGMLGASVGPGAVALPQAGARVGQISAPGGPSGPAPAPGGEGLSQMPFFSSELPQDFLQSHTAPRPPAQPQGQVGAPLAQQPGLHQAFPGTLHLGGQPASSLQPGVADQSRALSEHGPPMDTATSNLHTRLRLPGPIRPSAQGQVRAGGMTPSHPGGQGLQYGYDSSSSSPSASLPPSFPCSSGGPASLVQLYSDIIPDDKPRKKRNRKRDGDDSVGGGGPRTPLSSHSDDITAPPTPTVSDTSCSTPTRSMDQTDVLFPGLAPSSELERQLSVISAAQQRASVLGMESQRGPLSVASLEVKEEWEEGGACRGSVVKMEEAGEGFSSLSPLKGGGKDGDSGKELLRHLLKDKTSPISTPSPTSQASHNTRRQLSNESARSEEEDRPGSHGNMVTMDSPGPALLDSSSKKKTQRCKRLSRPEKDRVPPKHKKRKKEEEEKMLQSSPSSSDPLMTHLRQLSVLPLMEPVLGVDLSLFPPYGSSSLGGDSRLTGCFGNACLDGVTDYYSQLIYKQNNLSNPPTPPASLPPTPPPIARQKLVNGFATTEELTRKEMTEQEVKGVSVLKQKGEELLALNHATKTVDVPASLPTPPHNNQEELRVHDSSDRESPDGFIPSSSPESVADFEVSRYPDLSSIKLEPPSPCPSPTIPIMPCAWGKGSAVKQEVKVEPNSQGPPSCSNTDLVTIAITLNPLAAQNVAGVMAAVSELLQVPVPVNYQLSRLAGPQRSSLALLAGVRVPLTQGKSPPTQVSLGSRQQRPPPAAGSSGNSGVSMDYNQHGGPAATRPQCCNYCKVLLGNGVGIVKELKQEGQSRPGPSLVFCSPNCSTLYTANLQRAAGNKSAVPIVLPGLECPPPSRVQHQYTNNMSSIAVHSLPHTPHSPPPTSSSSSPTLSFPPASVITMETRPRMDSLKVKVKLKPRPRALPGGEDLSWHGKRMKSSRWRRWSISITFSRGPCIPNEAVAVPTDEELDVLLKKLGACLHPDPLPKDQRRCCFCHQQGDGQTDGPARLLNLDLDLWVHLNCALWSSEVYETQAGALINVELALRRGLTLRCAHCQQTGATSGCNRLRCTNTYHFTCALQAHCTFFKDKTMLCHLHKPRTASLGGDRTSAGSPSSTLGPIPDPAVMVTSDPYDSELRCFAVFRRVYVQRDEARQIAAVVQRGERQHTFRVGSLLFRAIGRLLPQQMKVFHNQAAIFPVGYHANRIYWSMRHSNRRCKYLCYIEEEAGLPLFKIKVVEKGHDDLILTGPTPKAVWNQILEPVAQMRSSSGTLKLFPVYLKGEDLFGLTTSAVTRIIESLPGVEACERYTFRYGRNPLMEWPLAFNPSGSARSEPKVSQAKRPYLLTSVAPRCQGSVGSIVGLVPGVISLSPGESVAGAHQGRHSKSSQYRRMKAEWKTNVYLARSRIQGLGLYAARDIEKCTMVIEYIGTIIRSEVANRKERLYESQNRGVYMFRIDNDYVIDATITGGPARYINHSCAPNCITEVVTVEKENKIIISSCRRIQRGEELCYDYKFDLEDDQHKIPCHCGAVNCRKWMN